MDASNLAKADLQTLGAELRAEMQSHRMEAKADLQALDLRLEARKADTIKWVVSAIGFQTIVLVGAVVAMSRLFQS